MRSRLHLTALLVALISVPVVLLTGTPTAEAAFPGAGGPQLCLDVFRGMGNQERGCTFHGDCRSDEVCFEATCVPEDEADGEAWAELRDDEEVERTTADPLPDDGGADDACGGDRRCRIERIEARNRMRRHYDAVEHERVVHDEAERILEDREASLVRHRRPWSLANQRHAFGLGIFGGRTFAGHFRAEASLVYQDRRINYVPDDSDASTVDGTQSATFATAHFTYLPSRAWFSPLLSVGFGMGRGDYGTGGGFGTGSPGRQAQSPDVRYDFVTAAIGAEAQFDIGFMFRVAYRHSLLIYNQVRNGPGNYDSQTRSGLREFMNDEGLNGIDFSIGWAF